MAFGPNIILDPNDSTFVTSVGHWVSAGPGQGTAQHRTTPAPAWGTGGVLAAVPSVTSAQVVLPQGHTTIVTPGDLVRVQHYVRKSFVDNPEWPLTLRAFDSSGSYGTYSTKGVSTSSWRQITVDFLASRYESIGLEFGSLTVPVGGEIYLSNVTLLTQTPPLPANFGAVVIGGQVRLSWGQSALSQLMSGSSEGNLSWPVDIHYAWYIERSLNGGSYAPLATVPGTYRSGATDIPIRLWLDENPVVGTLRYRMRRGTWRDVWPGWPDNEVEPSPAPLLYTDWLVSGAVTFTSPTITGPGVAMTWKLITPPKPDVAYLATGHFGRKYAVEAAATGTAYVLATSRDGIAWEPALISNRNRRSDIWFAANDEGFVVLTGWFFELDDSGELDWQNTGLALVSSDGGQTWTAPVIPKPVGAFDVGAGYDAAYGNGRVVVLPWGSWAAVGGRTVSCGIRNPTHWVEGQVAGATSNTTPFWVTFMGYGSTFLVVGARSPETYFLAKSADGITWSHIRDLADQEVSPYGPFASTDKAWYSIHRSVQPSGVYAFESSDQGVTWTRHATNLRELYELPTGSNAMPKKDTIQWHNGVFVMGVGVTWTTATPVGDRFGLLWSEDGQEWHRAFNDPFIAQTNEAVTLDVWSVRWDGDRWWAAGRSRVGPDETGERHSITFAATSFDGKTWTNVDFGDLTEGDEPNWTPLVSNIIKIAPSEGQGQVSQTGQSIGLRARRSR